MVRHSSVPTWEVHPEVSFALMLGRPARSAKTTWAGTKERVAALEREGIRLGSLGDAGDRAGLDDVLRQRSGTPAGIRGRTVTSPHDASRDGQGRAPSLVS